MRIQEADSMAGPMTIRISTHVRQYQLGWAFLAATGWMLIVIGLAAFGTAASIRVLPHEAHFLDSTVSELVFRDHAGNLIGYMMHNRVSFGGALIAIGLLYVWMANVLLREGAAWAWWAFLLSGYLGVSSFLGYFLTDYLDMWHGFGSIGLALTITLGLVLSFQMLVPPRGIKHIWPKDIFESLFSRFTIGRLILSIWAFGMMVGGFLVLETGVVRVFVPEDLQFMRSTIDVLKQINPQVIPFVAHDRIGFGGALFSCGIAALGCVWHGLKPGSKVALGVLSAAWFMQTITAIGVHPLVGYNNLWHLFPFLLMDTAFVVGLPFVFGTIAESKAGT
jgi:hypothetical protein